MEMQILMNTNIINFLLLIFFTCLSISQAAPTNVCGKIILQAPFTIQNNSTESAFSPMSKILTCKSQKLYFRTTLGLLQVSSVNYKAKTLTISHYSCSSSLNFISPTLLSSAFPSPPQPNSLVLFNCLNQKETVYPFLRHCTSLYGCEALYENKDQKSSCLIVHEIEKLERGFSPDCMNCSHYRRVYRDIDEAFKLGTVISYDIPDHVPNICDECEKPQGNCGVGLRCICHPKECRDKVISGGATMSHSCDIFISLLVFTVMYLFRF